MRGLDRLHLGGEVEDLGAELLHYLDRGTDGVQIWRETSLMASDLAPVEDGREVIREVLGRRMMSTEPPSAVWMSLS